VGQFTCYKPQTDLILRDKKPMIEIWSSKLIAKIVYKHLCILILTYIHRK
jgi:hypothetical protein